MVRFKKTKGNPVFIVDGSRTPFLKSKGTPGPFKALDLAIQATRPLLLRNKIEYDGRNVFVKTQYFLSSSKELCVEMSRKSCS